MSKKKNTNKDTAIMKRLAWEANVAEIREGRRQRAATFVDRKREASRKACRGRVVL